MKPRTLGRRDQNSQANRQKEPWPLHQIGKFDKGTRLTDKGQHPRLSREPLKLHQIGNFDKTSKNY